MDDIEPECMTGSGCIIEFDKLTDEDFRLLEIRFLLANLGELGLGEIVARQYDLDRSDLCQLAMIEAECRAMAQPQEEAEPQQETGDGEGH